MKFNHNFSSRFRILSKGRVVLAISVVASNLLYAAPEQNALPTNPVIVSGNIGISSSAPNNLTVNQTTNKGIINWDTFNIGSAANVKFNQPNVNSSTLNRVVGSELSQIAGTLSANGKVILINPNGVIFNKGSRVDVGGIVASTLDLSDENYLNDNYDFTRNGATGKVLNYGEITAQDKGFVALLAPEVINEGVVIARAGSVAFAAGDKVTLDFSGDGLLQVEVEASTIDTLIQNKNLVIADSGIVYMSTKAATELQNSTISNSGTIQANSIQEVGGKIILTGDDITLESTSIIEAKGAKGGGEVLVGGDWQGSNDVYQATTVTMESGATIDASATQNGDGGKVVLWSDITKDDSVTTVDGTILAKAGSQGGDGGNIETSGYEINYDKATINASSQMGTGGLWLIDPAFTSINQTNANTLASSLNGGTSVTNLVTSGSITVENSVSIKKTSGGDATLTLKTPDSITFGTGSSIISLYNKLNVVLWANSNGDFEGRVKIGAADSDTVKIETNGGDITIGGGSNSGSTPTGPTKGGGAEHGVYIARNGTLDAQGGNIVINGEADGNDLRAISQLGIVKTSGIGTISYRGVNTGNDDNGNGIWLTDAVIQSENGDIYLYAEGANNASAMDLFLDGYSTIKTTGSGNINVDVYSSVNVTGNVNMIDFNNASTKMISLGGGNITLNNLDEIELDGTIQSSGILTINATGSRVTNVEIGSGVDGSNSKFTFPISYFTSKLVDGFEQIIIKSSDPITVTGDLTVNDPLFLDTLSNITLQGDIITNNNNLTLHSLETTSLSTQLKLGTGDLELGGKFTLSAKQRNYTGNTNINYGTVTQITDNAFPTSTTLAMSSSSGIFDLNGLDATLGSLSSNSSATPSIIKANNLIVGGNNESTAYRGTISSANISATLTKNGSGTFTLSGDNSSFQGEIFVNAGTLVATNNNALGNSTKGTTVASGATLDVRTNVGAEPVTLNGGTLSTSTGSGSISGLVTLGANSTISVGGTQLTLSGVIGDGTSTYGFTKTGNGSLLLSGANTYGGATTVSAGTLNLGANNVIPDASAVSLASGTTFYLNNYSDTIYSLSGAGNVNLGSGTLTTSAGGTILSGVISGTGNLVKNGSGIFTLSGNNSYTGTTSINGGTLQIGEGSTTGTLGTGNVILSGGTSFLSFNRSGTLTVANNISGEGYVSKNGSSTLTLSGNNSYTKTTTISNGELIVTSNTGLGSTAGGTSISSGAILDLKNVSVGDEYISIASGGTLKTSSGTSSLTGVVNVGTSIVIDVSSGAQLTLSGKLDDGDSTLPQSTFKNGAGTLIITNNTNNYGSTVINAGTLQVGNGGTTGKLGSDGVTNNATLYINRSDSLSLSSIISSTSGITGTGNVTANIGGSFNVDRTITLSGASSKIILAAGYNTAAGTESGGDVTLTNTITTSNTGTVTIFSGNTNTSTLNSKIVGATGATKYKKYNVNNTAISGAVTGTRNFYYRADPKLTISDLTASKVYDGNTNAATSLLGGTVAGNIDGDSVYTIPNLSLASAASAIYSSKDAGSRTLTANYTVQDRTVSGYRVSGYTANQFSQASAGTITKKTVSLSGAKIYDGNTALTIGEVAITTGVGTETLTFSGATVNDAHVVTAGKYIDAITLQDGTNGEAASNYQLPTLNATNAALTISAKTLTPTISNTGVSKIYDGTTDAPAGFTPTYTYSGFVTGDSDATINNSSMIYNNSHVSSANKITVSGLSIGSIIGNNSSLASDYILDSTSKDVSATITPATLTSTISNTGVTKVYDGTTAAPTGFTPTYNITGFVSGDTSSTITNTGSIYDDAHVLTASKITVSGLAVGTITGNKGSQASDYTLDASSKEVNAAITPKNLTPVIASVNVSKTYDGTVNGTTAISYSYDGTSYNGQSGSGLVSGDSNAALTYASYIYDSKDAGVASKITVSGLQIDSISGNKGSLASDYSLTTNTLEQSGSIGKKVVTLAASKVYDGNTNLTNAVVINTGVAGEELAYSNAAADSAHVSNNAFNQINSITLEDNGVVLASNYKLPALNFANAPVTISAASLTAILNNIGVTKVYDGTINTSTGFTPTYTITGYVSGDSAATISNTAQAYNDAHVLTANKVGVSGMSITGITGSNSSETTDYVLSSNSSETTATITPATLTPTISNTGVTKIYDGTTNAPIGFVPTYTYSGLVSGDTNATLSHIANVYNDKDVLDANKITVSGLSVTSITGNKSSVSSDYILDATSKNVAAVITPKTLSLAASKVYDGSINLIGPAVTILTNVGSETLSYSGATANDANVLTANKYIDAITLLNGANGGVVSNYKLPTLNNIFAPVTITPASLIISANSFNKAYDAIPYFGGNGVIYKGFVASETPSILNGSLAYKGNSQSAVNTGVYDITPFGLSNSNYAITFVNGNLSIDPQKVIPIPTVPTPVAPPVTPAPATDVTNPPPVNNPVQTATPNNTSNAEVKIQETQVNSTVSFDGLVVGSTQTGDEVKAIIIQGAASSKVPFTLLVNVKAEEAFSFDIPNDIINQVSKTQVDVTLSDGNKLPSWLNFDENSMSFNSQNVPAGSFPLSVNLKMGTGINAKTIEVIIK